MHYGQATEWKNRGIGRTNITRIISRVTFSIELSYAILDSEFCEPMPNMPFDESIFVSFMQKNTSIKRCLFSKI